MLVVRQREKRQLNYYMFRGHFRAMFFLIQMLELICKSITTRQELEMENVECNVIGSYGTGVKVEPRQTMRMYILCMIAVAKC